MRSQGYNAEPIRDEHPLILHGVQHRESQQQLENCRCERCFEGEVGLGLISVKGRPRCDRRVHPSFPKKDFFFYTGIPSAHECDLKDLCSLFWLFCVSVSQHTGLQCPLWL